MLYIFLHYYTAKKVCTVARFKTNIGDVWFVRIYFAQAISEIALVDLYFILIGTKWAVSGEILIPF